MSVSKVAAIEAYSLLVNPPLGFPVSSRMIADDDTAVTRAFRSVLGLAQPVLMFTFTGTRSPTVGGATTRSAAPDRCRYHSCADATDGERFASSAARN